MKSDFSTLLERLAQAGVHFVVVGGFAGVVHGCTYVTQDIDICCDFCSSNLLRLQKGLRGLHPVHRMTPKRIPLELTEENCGSYKNLYLSTDIGSLDCLSSIDGVGGYAAVKRASRQIEMGHTRLHVLTLDALIKAKRAMNRPHDQEALRQLEAIKKLQDLRNDG